MGTLVSKARAFKTGWFSKVARKARVQDVELCRAFAEILQGRADDLGGGVFKKRLNQNMHRGIILAKGGQNWVYTYLFAKSDRSNIDDDELAGFRKLANAYAGLTGQQLALLLESRELTEICHVDKDQVQK